MVWTLFDYYGESHGWPNVACQYGQFDLAGFPKNTACVKPCKHEHVHLHACVMPV